MFGLRCVVVCWWVSQIIKTIKVACADKHWLFAVLIKLFIRLNHLFGTHPPRDFSETQSALPVKGRESQIYCYFFCQFGQLQVVLDSHWVSSCELLSITVKWPSLCEVLWWCSNTITGRRMATLWAPNWKLVILSFVPNEWMDISQDVSKDVIQSAAACN